MMNKERNHNMIKQIPYGLTDFGRIQKENYYYVDKTMFIKKKHLSHNKHQFRSVLIPHLMLS